MRLAAALAEEDQAFAEEDFVGRAQWRMDQ
jgi:hypothetical protein